MLSRDDCKYLAGLFDGEGSVHAGIHVSASGHFSLGMRLSITNTNPTVLYWLQNEVGGNVHVQEAGKDGRKMHVYRWVIGGKDSEKFARKILPYCRMKSGQLVPYIELRGRIYPGSQKPLRESPASRAEWKIRQKLVDKITSDPYRKRMGV